MEVSTEKEGNREIKAAGSSVKVSVIMPLYNDELYLAATLESLLAQTLREIEIIIVEDCSTDRSLEIARTYATRDKRIKVITHDENKGGGAARNTGMQCAQGEYLSFLDSDDYFYPNMLERAYNRAKQFDVDICVFNTEYAVGKTPVLNFNRQYVPKKDIFTAEDIPTKVFEVFNSVPWNKLFRHSFVKETGIKWSETFCSNDVVFVNSHIALARSITAITDVLIRYENRAIENSESKYNFYFKDAMGVYIELARILKSRNAFTKKIYQSFISRVSSALNWQLKSVNMEDKRAEYISWLKTEGFELLGFRSASFNDYLISNDTNFKNYLNIQKLLNDADDLHACNYYYLDSDQTDLSETDGKQSLSHIRCDGGAGSYMAVSYEDMLRNDLENYRTVVYATNENYLMPLSVSLISLLDNAENSTFYDIYILSSNIAEKQKADLINAAKSFSQRRFCNRSDAITTNLSIKGNSHNQARTLSDKKHSFRLSFIEVDKNIFKHTNIFTEHLDLQCFYRLLIPGLLPHVDKAIYIDCDTLVCKDLSELYTRNMNKYYVMGVRAAAFMANNRFEGRKLRELGIPDMKQYINSGFLVLNLANMRMDGLQEKFIQLSNRNFMQEDQDVINVACYGHIRHLPLKYNVMIKYFGTDEHSINVGKQVYSAEEIRDAMSSPVIIHYANKTKPWNDFNLKWADIWFKYAVQSKLFIDNNYYPWSGLYSSFIKFKKAKPLAQLTHKKTAPSYKESSYTTCKLSVIIPLYNAQSTLPQTIENLVLNLEALGDSEAILVDDNSYDRTLDLALEYAEIFPCIRVYSLHENTGPGIARNVGISKARGEYVAFLDGDDKYYAYDSLKKLYSAAKEHNAIACGGTMAENKGGKVSFGNYTYPLQGYEFQKEGFIEYKDWQFDYGFHRFIFRRDFLNENKISFPRERRYQDVLFLTKALASAKSFYSITDPVYVLSLHECRFSDISFSDYLECTDKVLSFAKENNFDSLYKITLERYLYFMSNLREAVITSSNKRELINKQINFIKKINEDHDKNMMIILPQITIEGMVNYYYPHVNFFNL